MTLGALGVLAPEAGLWRALAILAEVWNGSGPAADKDDGCAAMSVVDLRERCRKEYAEINCEPSTVRQCSHLLRRIVVLAIGRRKVAEIRRRDAAALHFNMSDIRERPPAYEDATLR